METNELLFPAEVIQFAKFCHTDDVMVKYYLVLFYNSVQDPQKQNQYLLLVTPEHDFALLIG